MKRIAVDIVSQIIGKVLSSFIGLLAITQICRYLTVEDFGGYTLAFSFLAFFHPAVDMGLNTIASREIAKDPAKVHSLLSGVIFLKVILATLAILLIFGLVNLLGYPLHNQHLILVASFSLFNTVLSTLEVVLIVRHRLIWLGLAQIFSSTAFLLTVYGVIALGRGASALIAAQILSVSLSYFIILPTIKGYFRLNKKIAWQIVFVTFKQALPLGVASVVAACYFNIDIIILSKMMNESAVAFYGSATRVLGLMLFIPHAIMMSLFPVLTRSKKQGDNDFSRVYKHIFHTLMLIGIPLAIWGSFFARPIIELIYTHTYHPAISVLKLLVWAGVGIFASQLMYHTLVVVNKQKTVLLISCFSLISNLCLNFLLIPIYGINGAAMATVISEFAVAGIGIGLLVYHERLFPFSRELYGVFIISMTTYLLALSMQETNLIVASFIFLSLLSIYMIYFFRLLAVSGG